MVTKGLNCKIDKNTLFMGECKLGHNVTILPFCVIENSEIEDNCIIGPNAHIRPNCIIKENCKIGNFCEIKNSTIGKNCKISHLSYVGDVYMGENCNIGAGTIFCNYDGITKHSTIIGDNTFIGSNSIIIAPRIIGKNCFLGALSVVNQNIPDNKFFVSERECIIKDNKFCKN